MRFPFLVVPVFALLLTSCANEGTVVRKDSTPLPFYHSLGVDGSYKLALRDNTGAVRSQLVTAEVYQDYAEGDYFNDVQPPLTPGAASPEMKETTVLTPAPLRTLTGTKFGNGNRTAANTRGSGRAAARVTTRPSSPTNSIASAPKQALPSPKAAIPVVAAHFSIGVEPPVDVAPVPPKVGNSPTVHAVIAKVQTAPSVHPAASTPPQKIMLAAAPTSRRSHHVASDPVGVTTALVSASAKAPAHPPGVKSVASKKAAKRPGSATTKRKSAD